MVARRLMNSDSERLRGRLEKLQASYNAWKDGKSHPDDGLFALIWEGKSAGVSRDDALDRIGRDQKVVDQLESGEIEFTDIVGYRALGTSKEMVLHNLHQRLDLYFEAMRCGGKNLTINQQHVDRMKANAR